MNTAPPVTVLMPTYNGARHVAEAVGSLLGQTMGDFRLIVVDDASTDGTVDAVAAFRDTRLTLVRNVKNLGLPENWNSAIERVDTPRFALAHQDDVYESGFLGAMIALLDVHPRAIVAHCRARTIDGEGRYIFSPAERYKDRFFPPGNSGQREPEDELRTLRRGNYILMPTAVYRTEAVRRLGGFDPAWRFVPDWHLWLRGLLAGHTIAASRRRLVRYRRHAGMATRRLEADLTRYTEEVALAAWIAGELRARGVEPDAQPDCGAILNGLLSETAMRLASGDLDGARRRIAFAEAQIPGFAGSARCAAVKLAARLGRTGGRLLLGVQRACLLRVGR